MAIGKRARIAAAAVVLVALGIFVPPSINVNRYKSRIAGAIAGAIGHPVTVGSVALRLLPQPGFTLNNLIVADDPAFSAEPLLRSEEVIASLRLVSLWRGRLEIAKLTLKEPSLNLVRSPAGTWNIESLLMRAVQTPAAPTANSRPEARPRFPYIEAENGRINLKMGQVKKVYALTDADFALWLASENEWRTRLDARPVRNDASLSDTGRLRVDGTLQRRARLAETPLQFRVRLQDAQLGQLSTLIYGRDRGWRGNANATLELTGSAAKLMITADATVEEFRRYDITPRDSLALRAHCVAKYSANADGLNDLGCTIPADNGDFTVRGSITGLLDDPRYDLSMVAREVPLSHAVAFIRRAKKDLPDDLTADGVLNAAFAVRCDPTGVTWSGGGNTQQLRLRSQALDPPLDVGTVAFVVEPIPVPIPAGLRGNVPHGHRVAKIIPAAKPAMPRVEPAPSTGLQASDAGGFQLDVQRFSVALGAAQPGMAHALFARDGYNIDIAGPADLDRLLQLAKGLGIAAPATVASGAAQVQVRIAGTWQGFPQPVVTGTAQLQRANVLVPGIEGPIQIASADVSLTADELRVDNVTASLNPGEGATVALAGWVRKPRGCDVVKNCVTEFSLRSDRIAADDLNRLLNPRLRQQPWYRRIGAATAPPSIFSRMRTSGKLSVDRFLIKTITVQDVSAAVQIEPGNVRISNINAEAFGGALTGDLRADFSGLQPAYSAYGTLLHASLPQVSNAMQDDWATGAMDAGFHLVFSGWTASELANAAAGSLDFHWRDGTLRHLTLGNAQSVSRKNGIRDDAVGPLRFKDFRGRVTLRDRGLTITESRMETPAGIYLVRGTASRGLALDLTFTLNDRQSYAVGGTLEAPRVEAVAPPQSRPAEMR